MSESVPRAIFVRAAQIRCGVGEKFLSESTFALLLDYTEGIKTQAGRFHSLYLASEICPPGFSCIEQSHG